MAASPKTHNIGRSEHISLESDLSETRAKPNPARILKSYDLTAHGRGIATSLAILADHYLLVESRARSATQQHTVDLRFVDPRPIGVRKLAKRSLYVGLGVLMLSALAVALHFVLPNIARQLGGVITPIALGAVSIACFAFCYYFTKETLFFVSATGRARVIVIAGRWGTLRSAQRCAADIATQIKVAQRQFQQSKSSLLRDEMREHSRLREQGALTEHQYDEAKKRILQAHD